VAHRNMRATVPETGHPIRAVGIVQRTAAWVLGLGLAFAFFDVTAGEGLLDTGPSGLVPGAVARQGGTGIRPASAEAPEIAGGAGQGHSGVSRQFMAVTANPVATEVATSVLAQGGTVMDAAVAVQMVLNLVEPQS